MLGEVAVKSVIDVGCGKGFSTNFFYRHGARVLCVEGSHDAVMQSLLPRHLIVEHDFSQGPWWPSETYDLAWSTEFLEHVSRTYMPNYMPIFKKSALICVTASAWGGWHHVEVHGRTWWIARFLSMGFVYSPELTALLRAQVVADVDNSDETAQTGMLLLHGLLVFVNPAVASLPRHRHLFGGRGCFNFVNENEDGGRACLGLGGIAADGEELPESYEALLQCSRAPAAKGGNILHNRWKCQPNSKAKREVAGQVTSTLRSSKQQQTATAATVIGAASTSAEASIS